MSLSQTLPEGTRYSVLLVSSMLNLAELLALRRDFADIPRKVLYMHENQFEYPKQYEDKEERDYYFMHCSVCSCLVADVIAWNSSFNLESFLKGLKKLNATLPVEGTCKPDLDVISKQIRDKSVIVPMPVDLPALSPIVIEASSSSRPLRIGWPHRWEHDKNPEEFLRVLHRLVVEAKVDFTVILFGGESFEGCDAQEQLLKALEGQSHRIEGCKRIESRVEYLEKLRGCDVVVSTAIHEFFGVAMVEAAKLGCKVLCPNRLAYPELFREEALYPTEAKLYKALRYCCEKPEIVQRNKPHADLLPGVWDKLDFRSQAKQGFDALLGLG